MKFLVLAFFLGLVCVAQASPIADDTELSQPDLTAVEPIEMLNEARQRICTALLCNNVCRSLGCITGSCNWQLYCICRR